MTRSIGALLVALPLLSIAAQGAAQRPLVDPGAREIRAYRLSMDNVRRVEQVTRSLDAYVPRSRDDLRPDTAFVGVMAMSLPYGTPYRDGDVDEWVRTIDGGHPDLAQAIARAGLSTRDYVLTQLSLLLGSQIVEQRKGGRAVTTTDLSPDSIAVIEQNWPEIERVVRELSVRLEAERRR